MKTTRLRVSVQLINIIRSMNTNKNMTDSDIANISLAQYISNQTGRLFEVKYDAKNKSNRRLLIHEKKG